MENSPSKPNHSEAQHTWKIMASRSASVTFAKIVFMISRNFSRDSDVAASREK